MECGRDDPTQTKVWPQQSLGQGASTNKQKKKKEKQLGGAVGEGSRIQGGSFVRKRKNCEIARKKMKNK